MRTPQEVRQALDACERALASPRMATAMPATQDVYVAACMVLAWVVGDPRGEKFGEFIDGTITTNSEEAQDG